MKRLGILAGMLVFGAAMLAATQGGKDMIRVYSVAKEAYINVEKVVKTDDEWRKILTPEEFHITREEGTERMCSGAYWKNHEEGLYRCVCCGNDLFQSKTKFESGTGWPSFFQPVAKENIITKGDDSFGMHRTEVLCARCGAHLGHVFEDGPAPTHLRYCMNSVALKFIPQEEIKKY